MSRSETKASFEGIVTLGSAEEAHELVRLVDAFVKQSVNVFYQLEKNPAVKEQLIRDVKRITELCSTFPPLCISETTRGPAQSAVDLIQNSERTLVQLLQGVVGGQKIAPETGKRIADQERRILEALVTITELMDEEQIHRILRAIKRAFEVVVVMKDTTNDFRFENKVTTFNTNIDVLVQLIDTRIDAIDNQEHRDRLKNAVDAIKETREFLIESTKKVTENPDQDNLALQQEDLKIMLGAISDIASVIKLPPPKSRASLSHDQIISDNLDALQDAVTAGSAPAAADAARKIADEIAKMKNAHPEGPNGGPLDHSALDDAVNRLRQMTGALVGAAKDAIQNPADAKSGATVRDLIKDMKQEAQTANKALKDYDTVQTHLKGSGMIEAAARAAAELQSLFANDF